MNMNMGETGKKQMMDKDEKKKKTQPGSKVWSLGVVGQTGEG